MASDIENVDTSAATNAFSIGKGRSIVASNLLSPGYYCTGMVMFTEVQGPTSSNPSVTGIRMLVIAATNPQGATQTLIYNTLTGNSVSTTGQLLAFTSAVQFQDGIYTNAGQQIRIRQWAGTTITLDGYNFIISAWQVSRPPAASFVSLSTTTVTNGSGPGAGTYEYAIAYLIGRATAQQVTGAAQATITLTGSITNGDTITIELNGNSVTHTVNTTDDTSFAALAANIASQLNLNSGFSAIAVAWSEQNVLTLTTADSTPTQYALTTSTSSGATEVVTASAGSLTGVAAPVYTDTTYQLTAPYLIPGSVTINSSDTTVAPVITIQSPIPTPFPSFYAGGDYTIIPVIFRASQTQATYFQVPFNGLGATYIDTSPDAIIAANVSLENTSIGTPPPFSFFLEQGFLPQEFPIGGTSLVYYDLGFQSATGFCVSHKGRLWSYALYPNTWDWAIYYATFAQSGSVLDVLLQAQIWWSTVGVAWQFDSVNGVLPVGPEEVVGNVNTAAAVQLPIINKMPWLAGLIEDTPMGAKSIGSELVLFKSNNLYKVWGDTGAEFTVYPIADIGCMAVNSIVPFEGGVGWLAPQGVYFYNGGTPSYIGESVRGIIDGLTFAQIQACQAFYRERTYYLSFPNVVQTVPPTITPETSDGTNSGTASVVTGTVTQNAPEQSASTVVTCQEHVRITPAGEQTFWTCTSKPGTTSWSVSAAAPTSSGHEVTFEPTSLSGTAANLSLVNPSGNTVASWTDITVSTTYSYYNASAGGGTHTWVVTPNVSAYGGGSSDEGGTYTSTVTPTLTYYAASGTAVNGPVTTLSVTSAVAPTASANALTLAFSDVTAPSDANGKTSYTATLVDQTGFQWYSQSGITSAQTLSFTNDLAPPGNYTWTVQAVVTVLSGGGSSNYSVSANLVAGWNEESGGQVETQGFTLAYYTPTQQWYKYNVAVNAAVTSDFPDNLAYVFTDQTLYTWDSNEDGDASATSITATWTGAVESGNAPGIVKEYRYLVLSAPQQVGTATVTVNITAENNELYSWTTPSIDLDTESQCYVASLPTSAGIVSRGYTAQLELSVTGTPGTIIRNVFLVGTDVRDFAVSANA